MHDDVVTILAQECERETGDPCGEILVAAVPLAAYQPIYAAVHDYWAGTR